jgi:hypothetical protein
MTSSNASEAPCPALDEIAWTASPISTTRLRLVCKIDIERGSQRVHRQLFGSFSYPFIVRF